MPTRRSAGSRLRVSIVHPWDPWLQGIGGFDTFLDGFLRHAPEDWSLELIGTTSEPDKRPVGRWLYTEYDGRSVSFLPLLAVADPNQVSTLPLSLRFVWAARRTHPEISGDVVVFHRFESRFAVDLQPGAQKVVFYLHNHPGELRSEFSGNRWSRLGPLLDWALIWTLRRADLVVAVDPRTPAWLACAVPRLQGSILPQRQWADPTIFHPPADRQRGEIRTALRERLSFDEDLPILVYAGRLEKQKAPFELLEIFEQAVHQIGPLGLILVGDGRLKTAMERHVRQRRLDRWIRFMPPVERGELASIYHACDVSLCTSWFEAGPRHVFESLASGLPVVSFDVGQVGRVLDTGCRTGYLVAERSSAEFIRGLACVLAIPISAERSRECVERVAEFTPEAALRPILAAYEQLADQSMQGRRGSQEKE